MVVHIITTVFWKLRVNEAAWYNLNHLATSMVKVPKL